MPSNVNTLHEQQSMLKQLQVPPAFFLNLTSAPQALLAIWNGFDLEFLKPRLCSREILKNNVFWTLAGLPSPAGILYLGPKRFLRYMGVGAIRAIQSMTLKMIITRNMGGGAAIQRVLCQSRGVTVPRSRRLCGAQICQLATASLHLLSI